MTLLWETETDEAHYSVRSSGASVRLYTNRVFHSQWNPRRPFSGGVWDCLSLPALYRQPEILKRVLVLGVGGGAVIRQLQLLLDFDSLLAVDIDQIHLQVARQWFGIDDSRMQLVQDDAGCWLQNWQHEGFDLIIDDLFGHDQGEPLRAIPLSAAWVDLLLSRLNPGGLLVANCIDSREMKQSQSVLNDQGFQHGVCWTLPNYENAIVVVSESSLQPREWSRRLESSRLSTLCQRQARCIKRRPLRGWSR